MVSLSEDGAIAWKAREFMEFYIALVPGGALSPRLFNLKIGDRIWLSSKITGKFTFDNSRVPVGANLILIATLSGLAPFMSMLSTYVRFHPCIASRSFTAFGTRGIWVTGRS